MNKQNVKPYITPTVMSVEFKVEVGAALSAYTSSFTPATSDWMLTTSSQSNNEAPQRSTSNFFEYDW